MNEKRYCHNCCREINNNTDICSYCGYDQTWFIDVPATPKEYRCSMCWDRVEKICKKYGICYDCYGYVKNSVKKSPATAFSLSIVPGLGHVYVGYEGIGQLVLGTTCIILLIPEIRDAALLPFLIVSGVDAYLKAYKVNEIQAEIR